MIRKQFHIPDMQSSHCQNRVRTALEALPGVQVHHTENGLADISFGNEQEIRRAVSQAGYTIEDAEAPRLRFKTNINCEGCIAGVSPALNGIKGMRHWEVDTTVKDKILTVDAGETSAEAIMEAVQKAGFRIEPAG